VLQNNGTTIFAEITKNYILISLKAYKAKWQEIPGPIRRLIVLSAILLTIWKTLYTFWLEPNRILDGPLTRLVAQHSVNIMQTFWPDGHYTIKSTITIDKADSKNLIEHLFIVKNGQATISIADNCNGLELMVLYAAFILVIPGGIKRKLIFITAGIPLLHIANLGRVIGLVGLHLQYPGMFNFAHHYLFKIMVYAISFGLWVWYLKPITKASKSNA
jgi:exosortase/archaeosortase family protein